MWIFTEIAGGCFGAIVGYFFGFGEIGFIVGLAAGGLVHILLHHGSD